MSGRLSRAVCLAALLALWVNALRLWPSLPERFPVHFDAAGEPDRWQARSLGAWLLLPVLGTLVAALLGLLLPAWLRRLAHTDSPWLNVPRRSEFGRLQPVARVAAVEPLAAVLRWLAAEVALLFAALLGAAHAIATGRATTLPSLPVWGAVAVLLVTAGVGAWWGSRSVRRAVDAAGSAAQRGNVSDGSAEDG